MKYPRNKSFFTKERSPRGVSDLGEVFPPQVPEARNMRYPEKFCSRTWEWRDRQEERGAKAFGEGRHEEHGRPDADVLQGNQKNFSVATTPAKLLRHLVGQARDVCRDTRRPSPLLRTKNSAEEPRPAGIEKGDPGACPRPRPTGDPKGGPLRIEIR